ncbi:hypothetical protein ADICYQ_2244 [Cyclobacterium qasimii M12-11B]|uniref:Uncharacterized protein n=1 Tax=Cyclobacterium qasimii M12-11B TaxID=641524 RepID=S7WY33_9BACT|nr:hypothetical protein ADICYQ_2244 [Cyclobacterium qasimii M12-11B]
MILIKLRGAYSLKEKVESLGQTFPDYKIGDENRVIILDYGPIFL